MVYDQINPLQGAKVSLSAAAISSITPLDSDVLHLTWTVEKLQQQLDVIDQRCERLPIIDLLFSYFIGENFILVIGIYCRHGTGVLKCFLGLVGYFCNYQWLVLFYRLRKSALSSLNSGNRMAALRHARELKMSYDSREKCTSLLNRVEEVISVIANAESTKNVSQYLLILASARPLNDFSRKLWTK